MSRGRASQQAVDESARSAERGRDAEAVAVGPGWPVCNAHRLREAQGTRRRQAAGHVIGRRFFSPVFFGRAKKIGSPDRAKPACDESPTLVCSVANGIALVAGLRVQTANRHVVSAWRPSPFCAPKRGGKGRMPLLRSARLRRGDSPAMLAIDGRVGNSPFGLKQPTR